MIRMRLPVVVLNRKRYIQAAHHWQADNEAAEQILAIAPEVRAIARANRAFLRRAVTYLAQEKGVTQFLDVGTGIPTSPNVHETAAACARDTRVVYADNDPVIHAHANALLTGTGTTRIILADLRHPELILAARDFLDFTKPVALLLVAILHFIPDAEASRPQENRHLRRRRRQELTACPGCGSSSSRTIRSFAAQPPVSGSVSLTQDRY